MSYFSIRASGSFGLFVGQCVASLETSVMSSSGTPLSQSDVTRSSLFLLSLCSLLSVGVASATECLPVVLRACARRSQGKHVLRSKNQWIVRLILSALWRSVTWNVVALWRFLVGPEGSGFNQSDSRLLLIKFFIRRYFSKEPFGFLSVSSFAWSSVLKPVETSMVSSSNTFFRRATWRGHFWFIPLGRLLCSQVEIFKCRCFSRSVCRTSSSWVQAHQRVVIAAQFVGLRLGNVLGKLPFVSPRFCRSWRRCFPTTTDHA